MDRKRALRIFGVPEFASEERLQAAYWRLRAHLESRCNDAEEESERGALKSELADLDLALEAAIGSDAGLTKLRPELESGQLVSPRVTIPLAVLALLVLALALAGGVQLVGLWRSGSGSPEAEPSTAAEGTPGGDEAEEDAEAEGLEAGEGGQLSVKGNLDAATFEVVDVRSGAVLAAGLADGSAHELPPGSYDLRVEHGRCPDAWSREVQVADGGRYELAAENCLDQGWLVVRSNVADDSLEIDGQPYGSTGSDEHPLPWGDHAVRISKAGYVVWEGEVSVPPAEVVRLKGSLSAETRNEDARKSAQRPPAQQRRPEPQSQRESATQREIEGNNEWHRTAKQYLLSKYDTNRSGSLDTPEEIASVPCEDLLGLERSFDASGLRLSLMHFYGFDGTKWVDGALGVTEEMRATAALRLKDCGLR